MGDMRGTETILEVVDQRLSLDPSQLAFGLINDDRRGAAVTISLDAFDARVARLAARLATKCQPGDRVLLISRDVFHQVVALLACWRAGLIGVSGVPPHPPRARAVLRQDHRTARLNHILENARPTAVIAPQDLLGAFRQALGNSPLSPGFWIAETFDPEPTYATLDRPAPAPQDVALIQYTSGSTAGARGVVLTHANLLHNLHAQLQGLGLGSSDIGVSWLPAHHDMGLIGTGLLGLAGGFPFYLMQPEFFAEDPLRWLRAISDHAGTLSFAPNFAYAQCAQRVTSEALAELNLESWRCAMNGSEPIQAATLNTFSEIFGSVGFASSAMRPGYGLAESTLVVSGGAPVASPTIRRISRQSLSLGCSDREETLTDEVSIVACGAPLPGVDVLIVNTETGDPNPEGKVGEIWVGGPSVGQGYWQNPEATSQSFGAIASTGQGPYLRTGDLGFTQDGQLYFTGRLKDLLILNGANHYPQDVEAIVENSHAGYLPGGCVAFTIDEANGQQLVVAAEVHRHRETEHDGMIARARRATFDEMGLEIAAIMLLPRGGVLKTPSGKLQRSACRDAYQAGRLAPLHDWRGGRQSVLKAFIDELEHSKTPTARSELLETLVKIAESLGVTKLAADSIYLADLGVDSLGVVELAVAIRRVFGVSIKAAELHEVKSLSRVADLIWSRISTPETSIHRVEETAFEGGLTPLLTLASRKSIDA